MNIYTDSLTPVKGVILDVGGPLRDSSAGMNFTHRMAFELSELDDYALDNFGSWQLFAIPSDEGNRYEAYMRRALALYRAGMQPMEFFDSQDPRGEIDNLVSEYVSEADEALVANMAAMSETMFNKSSRAQGLTRASDGAVEGIRTLYEYDIDLGVVTSAETEGTIKWIDDYIGRPDDEGLYVPEPFVMGKDSSVSDAKSPKSEKILKICEEMGLTPEEVMYIGDTTKDIQEARDAGVQSGQVLNGMGLPSLWEDNMPDYEFEDLAEASRFITDPWNTPEYQAFAREHGIERPK